MCVCAGHVEGIIDVEKSLDQCGVCVCAGHVEGISDVEKSLDQCVAKIKEEFIEEQKQKIADL